MTELIAADAEDYVRLAVRLGTDREWRAAVRERIREAVPRLFGRSEAVDAWSELRTRLAEEGPPPPSGRYATPGAAPSWD